MFIFAILIIGEAICWMLGVNTPGDTNWLMWLWLTLGFYLLLNEPAVVKRVQARTNRRI